MKPIYLRFSGLHSYVEEQRIDFAYLMGAGVFGIFGPTGSGKSTILDALTLALYGSVERALRNTQGIINQYSTQASVAFTFELEDTGSTRRFRVERTFRRGKIADSVEALQARFLELVPGPPGQEDVVHVLADKAGAVTDQVEEVLGLTLADFTRAVVLPQGKFAEFLGLRGVDRRSMLQRLFGLELYGDRLMQKVKDALQTGEQSLTTIKAAQAELGDASPQAVKTACTQAEQAHVEHQRITAETAALELEFAHWERVWGLQAEWQAVEQQLNALRQRETQVKAQEAELQAAQRAESARSALTLAETADVEQQTAVAAQQQAQQVAQRAQMMLDQAKKARKALDEAWASDSPHLYNRKANLERAVGLEQRYTTQKTLQNELDQKLKMTQAELNQRQNDTARAVAKLTHANAELTRIRAELLKRTVDPATRARVAAAMVALTRLNEAEQQIKREQKECTATEANVHAAVQREQAASEVAVGTHAELHRTQELCSTHKNQQPWDEQELQFRRRTWQENARVADQVQAVHPLLVKAQKEAAQLNTQLEQAQQHLVHMQTERDQAHQHVQTLRSQLELAEKALEQARRADLAAGLAVGLIPGDPCPVCGSTTHPRVSTESAGGDLHLKANQVDEVRRQIIQAETTLSATTNAWTQAAGMVQLLQTTIERHIAQTRQQQHELGSLMAHLPRVWCELTPSELQQAVQQEETSLLEREQALQNWLAEVKRLEEALRNATALAAEADKQLAARQVATTAARQAYTQAHERVEKASTHAQTVRLELDAARHLFSVEEVVHSASRFALWDKEAVALRHQETTLIEQAKTATQMQEQGRQQEDTARVQLATILEQRKSLEQQLHDLHAELAVLIGTNLSAYSALEQLTAEIDRRICEQKSAVDAEMQAAGVQQQAMQTCAGADERRNSANLRSQEAHANLSVALQQQGFPSVAELKQALRPAETRQQLQQDVSNYREELNRYVLEHKRIEAALNGEKLASEAWQAWQEQVVGARKMRDAALQAAAVAANMYQEILARNARWQELAANEAAVSLRVARLQDLAALLRGHAFVDFLAEQQLQQVAWEASAHLGKLTRYRYAVEVASDGSFLVRDDASGGYKRAVSTLSGGETFLTSLALALALSSQIQLRGRYPLQFFFLDEGFGSLDQELLDVVMTALERLNLDRLHVGVISHVPELRNRILRRLVVQSSVPGEHGSKISVDV